MTSSHVFHHVSPSSASRNVFIQPQQRSKLLTDKNETKGKQEQGERHEQQITFQLPMYLYQKVQNFSESLETGHN